MAISVTSLIHPATKVRIFAAMTMARKESLKTGSNASVYLENRNGDVWLRITHSRESDQSFNFRSINGDITKTVLKSLRYY